MATQREKVKAVRLVREVYKLSDSTERPSPDQGFRPSSMECALVPNIPSLGIQELLS